ncbi:MAG: zinc ABC transporter ATP-binding protein ZnuC [Alphaproteobacteria bacterium]|nr:zinc ABC transporter ATP-binding protein ZnuC [Alphaproteobacteria bacterium]
MRHELPTEALIEVRGVSVRHNGHATLDNVDLTVCAGEIVTLIGPNGSGKTTLVKVALGLTKVDAGGVHRKSGVRIGYMPQHLTVDLTLPLTVRRFLSLREAGSERDALDALAEVGVEYVIDNPFQTLSGGEARRVLLARALLGQPDLLVLDEPSAGIDVMGQGELYDLVRKIRDQRGCSVLLVSHDLHLVMAATDQVLCLNHHICCAGQPETVAQHPEYLALFGTELRHSLAVYTHDHDHHHDLAGETVDHADHDHG